MPLKSQKAPSTKVSKKPKSTSQKTPKGLGDSIENFTKKTGIKKIVDAVVGEDCGCDKRKDFLNRIFPYFAPMSDKDKTTWEKIIKPSFDKGQLNLGEQGLAIDIYERVYGQRKKKSRCGSCVKLWLADLEKAYEASCDE